MLDKTMKCHCGKNLKGKQTKFCSTKCKNVMRVYIGEEYQSIKPRQKYKCPRCEKMRSTVKYCYCVRCRAYLKKKGEYYVI